MFFFFLFLDGGSYGPFRVTLVLSETLWKITLNFVALEQSYSEQDIKFRYATRLR